MGTIDADNDVPLDALDEADVVPPQAEAGAAPEPASSPEELNRLAIQALEDVLPAEKPSVDLTSLNLRECFERACADGIRDPASPHDAFLEMTEGLMAAQPHNDAKHALECLKYQETSALSKTIVFRSATRLVVFGRDMLIKCGFPAAVIDPGKVSKQDDVLCARFFCGANVRRVREHIATLEEQRAITFEQWRQFVVPTVAGPSEDDPVAIGWLRSCYDSYREALS
jgi:hypothetical protein